MINTLRNRELSAAAICKANGWGPGTRLQGDEGNGPEVIEITAVGRENIIAYSVTYQTREASWVLWCRDWRPVVG